MLYNSSVKTARPSADPEELDLILFHASNVVVEKPVIMNRFKTLDFGTGFYTTVNEEQARDFAIKVHARRKREGSPIVNVYECDLEAIEERLNVVRFDGPDAEWLEFVVHNRRNGRDENLGADVIIGPVANDDVFTTVALYEAGQIDAETAIKRFKVKELFSQVLFCNEKALGFLSYERHYEVGDEK